MADLGGCTEGSGEIKKFSLKSKSYMIRNITLFLMFLINSLAVCPSYAITVDRVIATVGNDVITLTDYKQFVKSMDGNIEDTGKMENKDVVDETLLKRLIEERIILQEAKSKGIEVSDEDVDEWMRAFIKENGVSQEEFEEFLKEEGMDLNDYMRLTRDKIISLKLINIYIDSKVVINDDEIEAFYSENKKNYIKIPVSVVAGAIFLRVEKDASVTEITELKRRSLKIASLLKKGESFDRLVYEYSDEPLKSQEGILGEFTKGELIPPLDTKVFSMEKGEISDPVWVSDGVYILHLIDRKTGLHKPIEEVEREIYYYLFEQKREKLFNNWIEVLWEKASVKIQKD
jgi:peptidyl-prolyl cis-trans isomerase SurA